MNRADAATATRDTPVLLADGSDASIRELEASDRPAVEELFTTADPDHLYTRFFTVGTTMVRRHIDHLFADGASTTSYILERDRTLLGIADVEHLDHGCAEVAFFVAGDAHGLGIATLLLERAADDAWRRGITTFVADVLPANRSMLEVFRDAGFEYEFVNERGDVLVKMSTQRTPAALAASAARRAVALSRRSGAHGTDA
ncbi:GNAT family N-acetyltransferase [Aeromicrobium wangtongii]|uniref:GNAT family N-acetyltransferase n=1 Tax=Aeromicrobium wangtongii TaxID=2969247 RepID=A0ABY5M5L6_9ACTN|nr:GNAT family N-acetyltransferase [Aeromicrobium wangtongii]MCD9198218.1 GNAT family N-acetyltransferase [Aeromicrobium wangtongii]UUP12254.1 GNAT family N-acetyltransferase [Aeromicrobium wangtongii]